MAIQFKCLKVEMFLELEVFRLVLQKLINQLFTQIKQLSRLWKNMRD